MDPRHRWNLILARGWKNTHGTPTPLNTEQCEAYLRSALALHGIELSAEQMQRVLTVFQRNADIAKLVVDFEFPDSAEVAPRFEA